MIVESKDLDLVEMILESCWDLRPDGMKVFSRHASVRVRAALGLLKNARKPMTGKAFVHFPDREHRSPTPVTACGIHLGIEVFSAYGTLQGTEGEWPKDRPILYWTLFTNEVTCPRCLEEMEAWSKKRKQDLI